MLIGAIAVAATRLRWQAVVAATLAFWLVATVPPLLFPMAAAGGLAAATRRWHRKCRVADMLATDAATLCDLTAIALTGGLGLSESLVLAAEGVGGVVEEEVAELLRCARVDGMATALAEATGAGNRLYRVLGRAFSSGAEVVESVRRLADEINAEQAAARLEAVRRAPVLMLIPLTILILPGFLLLAIAPAIIDAFSRLDF